MKISNNIRQKMVGQTYRVLVQDKHTMKGVTKWQGRTSCMRIVHFEGPENIDLKWHWVDLKVTSSTGLSAQGDLIADLGKK
jgi:tRNA A37 methylthiotransferase MiaB